MPHQPRRRRAQGAGIVLGVLVLAAILFGRTSPLLGTPTARAGTSPPERTGPQLDPRTEPVFVALNRERIRSGLPDLDLDAELIATSSRDACAIARGELALSGDEERTAEAGGRRENLGMVIDEDPAAGARTMHDWWAHTRRHRLQRMDPQMVRYGIGACNAEDRTYYVERLAP